MMSKKMPTFDELMNPMLEALFAMGGSASIDEIYEKVLELEKIPESVSSVPHDPEKSNTSEVMYRLAWARTYLKKYGVLENSTRGVWSLTAKGQGTAACEYQGALTRGSRVLFSGDERTSGGAGIGTGRKRIGIADYSELAAGIASTLDQGSFPGRL